jgi:hypothetical protein
VAHVEYDAPAKEDLMSRSPFGAGAALPALCAFVASEPAAADLIDAPDLFDMPAADIGDVYAFTTAGDRLVIAMSVNRFANIMSGLGGVEAFDPAVLYQFKIDRSQPLDGEADVTIDVQFNAAGTELAAGSHVRITGLPALHDGAATVLALGADGSVSDGEVKVFAGLREDPLFMDLVWFIEAQGEDPLSTVVNDGDSYYQNLWSGPADPLNAMEAFDTLAGSDVSMIVLEFPRAAVLDGGDTIGLWAATRMVPAP